MSYKYEKVGMGKAHHLCYIFMMANISDWNSHWGRHVFIQPVHTHSRPDITTLVDLAKKH